MKLFTIMITFLALTGCAVSDFGRTTDGGAVYRYHKTPETCTLEITSARTVSAGDIKIGKNCELESKADNAGSQNTLNKVRELLTIE